MKNSLKLILTKWVNKSNEIPPAEVRAQTFFNKLSDKEHEQSTKAESHRRESNKAIIYICKGNFTYTLYVAD